MKHARPNLFLYRLTQCISWFVAVFVFRRRFLRNEIKGKSGPFVVIANHQAALDFTNLIGATNTPMAFVVSRSIYETLPVKRIMRRIGVIPKQQFQTNIRDLKQMRAVIDDGRVLVRDSNDNRYEIEDINALDKKSRRMLATEL